MLKKIGECRNIFTQYSFQPSNSR